jgi:fimbrial chaperone protein
MLLIVFFIFLPVHVIAGSFKVSPLKLFLDEKTRTAILKVTNNGDEKVTIQLDAKKWLQEENKDWYEPTEDVVYFPRITGIDKGKEQIIRVGFQGKPGSVEKSYRLFVQELPVTKPGETALKFALRMSIPLFIQPLKVKEEKSIQGIELKEGRLLVKTMNTGTTHFMVSKIKAIGQSSTESEVFSKEMGGWYVLPSVTKQYIMDVSEEECLKSDLIKISLEVSGTSLERDLTVAKEQCKRPEKPDASEKNKRPKEIEP